MIESAGREHLLSGERRASIHNSWRAGAFVVMKIQLSGFRLA